MRGEPGVGVGVPSAAGGRSAAGGAGTAAAAGRDTQPAAAPHAGATRTGASGDASTEAPPEREPASPGPAISVLADRSLPTRQKASP